MSRRRRNETDEQRARRELIRDFLTAANIRNMDDIQELFKEALAGFMETYDPTSGQLNWMHKVISNFKAMLAGTYHGNEKIHTALYAAEYCYKFNRRKLGNSAYLRLLAALVQ